MYKRYFSLFVLSFLCSVGSLTFSPAEASDKPLQESPIDMSMVRQKAEAGDLKAQTLMGVSYALGRGVPQDYAQSMTWYKKAAEKGSVEAQTLLGTVYAKGQGVPRDEKEAVKWFRKAADKGSTGAQHLMGVAYTAGKGGLPQDGKEAAKWYRKAAVQGYGEAQGELGMAYFLGHGVPQDKVQAYAWITLASLSKNPQIAQNATKIKEKIAQELSDPQKEEGQKMSTQLIPPSSHKK